MDIMGYSYEITWGRKAEGGRVAPGIITQVVKERASLAAGQKTTGNESEIKSVGGKSYGW
jgi:hypothetical protein